PRQTWLESLTAQSPGAATAGTAPVTAPAAGSTGTSGGTGAAPAPAPVATADSSNGMHLTGFALDHRQVALLLARLGTVSGLGEPKLTSSTAEARGGRRVVKFVVDVPVDQRAQDRPILTTGVPAPTSTTGQP
ncbi:MAG: PilN domain-containing protein, partial [Actinomycetota bacterium]